jgi:Spy/CpxP family protein refolding chaperone
MSTALKWKLAAGFFLVFLAGATMGALVWSWHERQFFLGPPRSGALAHRMSERLRTQLALTPEQSAKIAPIVEQSASKLETIRVETASRVRQTLTEANLQISPELTPEQRTKLSKIEERHRGRARHRGFPPLRPAESPAP